MIERDRETPASEPRNVVEEEEARWISEQQASEQPADAAPAADRPVRIAGAEEGIEQTVERREGATFADPNLGGSATHQRASFSDPVPRYSHPADSTTGQDVSGSRDVLDSEPSDKTF